MAMAAIVAQNGATGQSLVEQFTTGAVASDAVLLGIRWASVFLVGLASWEVGSTGKDIVGLVTCTGEKKEQKTLLRSGHRRSGFVGHLGS